MEVKDCDNDALIEYAKNNIKVKELEIEIDTLRERVSRLCDQNNEILRTGKISIFNSDDIPF